MISIFNHLKVHVVGSEYAMGIAITFNLLDTFVSTYIFPINIFFPNIFCFQFFNF